MKKKRTYLTVLVIIMALMLFGIQGILSSCSFLAGELNETTSGTTAASGTTTAAETSASETTSAETTASTTAPETTAAETTAPETTAAETTAPPTTTTAPETTPPPKPVAPTIKLKIYEGPTYSAIDDLCYYRVVATVTGTPRPVVTFSKDDSNGTWGKLKTQVNLSRANPNYTLTVTAKNSAGTDTDSIDLSWGCGPLFIEKTMEIRPSNLANIDSAGTIDNGSVVFGDSISDKDVRGFFAFDVSPLDGKKLVSASLKLVDPSTTAKIDFKGNIQIWYVDFLSSGINSSDYMNVPYSGPQSFKWNVDPLQFSTAFLMNIISDRAAAQRKLEFGIWFANPATGGNSGVDEVRAYHNNDIVLTVVYEQ